MKKQGKPKIIFMGSPDFSAKVLEILHPRFPVCAVVTGPDKPVGRGYELKPSALKVKAEELSIPVLQYEKVSRDGIEQITALEPDVIVTAAFGQILSEKFLSVPKYGVLNVHASLLPKYRGASPVQSVLLAGEKETGITIMRTVREVDAGDILLCKRTPIGERETAGELFDRLAALGGEAICEAIEKIEDGSAVFTPQNACEATHCGMITKSDGKIDFSKDAAELDRFVRAMTPWPSAFTRFNGKLLKVFAIGIPTEEEKAAALYDYGIIYDGMYPDKYDYKKKDAPGIVVSLLCYPEKRVRMPEKGQVLLADPEHGIIVACGDGAVRLEEIQLEGCKRMSGVEFLKGRAVPIGCVFK